MSSLKKDGADLIYLLLTIAALLFLFCQTVDAANGRATFIAWLFFGGAWP